tara:strand:- start:27 stop:1772 length:1746 start_codon:yes stop_codon:yes gene_type:complete
MWGIITSRKGSQRLSNKNKLKFINKPLIERTFANTQNTFLDKVILSTDCSECIEIAKKYRHIECPFIRPSELSSSTTKSIDVIKHCLQYYKEQDISLPEYIVILQPTSPQRTREDINYLINYIKQHKYLNGLSTFSHTNHNSSNLYTFDENNNIKKLKKNINSNGVLFENGLCFIVKTSILLNTIPILDFVGSLPYENIEHLVYPKNKVIVDIDTIDDFDYAEYLIKKDVNITKKNDIVIGDRIINQLSKPFVIAEVGINHECDMKKAVKMIYDAYYSGCECVKFQCHIPESEMTPHAKEIIPSNADEDIFKIIEKSSLTEKEEIYLKNIVEDLGMIYLCTPFSIDAANRLERMGVKAYKIGSGEMNNLQLIEHVAKFGKPMLISTGMNPLHKIRTTVEILEKYNIKYCLFHCVSIYPTPYDKVNFPGIDDLKYEFPNALIGLSDHSIGITSCFGAYMKGCRVFEKHYTSYMHWTGPDIEISITPKLLKDLIIQLDILSDCCKGNGRYTIQNEEQGTIDFAFCTLTATKDLYTGHILSEEDLIAKRPNIGDFLAEDIPNLIGKSLLKDIKKEDKLFKENTN